MNAEHAALWQRIDSFTLDDAAASYPFSARLARENGWSRGYALRVVEEYKRFVFLAMVAGAFQAQDGLAAPHWLLITYVVYTWGELCLSPVGLSMVTKLAPEHLQSLMMGVWFFTFSLANLLGGLMAAFSKQLESGAVTFIYPGLPGFYMMMVVFPIGAAVIITLLSPRLKRMMHGVQ